MAFVLPTDSIVKRLPADHFPRDLFVLLVWSGIPVLCLLRRPQCLKRIMTSHRAKAGGVPLCGLVLYHLPWIPFLYIMAAALAGTWGPTLQDERTERPHLEPHGLSCAQRPATLGARSSVSCMQQELIKE